MSTRKRSHNARSRKKTAPSPVTNTSPGVVGGGVAMSTRVICVFCGGRAPCHSCEREHGHPSELTVPWGRV